MYKQMIVSHAKIECEHIHDWNTFHDEFERVFGFPEFYGRNMNAWIDCMSSLATPDDGLTAIHCEKGKMITIELNNVKTLKQNIPNIYNAVVESTAFVNWRLIEIGEQPVLGLSFSV